MTRIRPGGSVSVPHSELPVGVLNSPILTEDGVYEQWEITVEEARELVRGAEIDSAVGHESTAALLSQLLGREIPADWENRFSQQPGQVAVVIQLAQRLRRGALLDREEVEKVGYKIKILRRLPT